MQITDSAIIFPWILVAWAAALCLVGVSIWMTIKIIKKVAQEESKIWDLCVKHPNDADLGKAIREIAWKSKEDDRSNS